MHRQIVTIHKRLLGRVPIAAQISIVICLVLFILYGVIYFIPKTVHFSYADQSCVPHLLIAPGLHVASSEDFSVSAKGNAGATGSLCIAAKSTPTPGEHIVTVSPLGGWFAAKQFKVIVDTAPTVTASALSKGAISAALPLKVPLSSPDTVHTYTVTANNSKAPCTEVGSELSCKVADLSLKPGEQYEVALQRSFDGSDTKTLLTNTLETLVPLQLTSTDIKDGDTVYTEPEALTFSFDHEIDSSDVQLVTADEAKTAMKMKVTAKDKTLRVELPEEMARNKKYTLTLQQVISKNGNSLEAPLVSTFTLSGGPEVTSVSIGSNNTAQNATAVITFDQPIAEDVDVTKFIKLTGVPGVVQKKSATEVTIKLKDAPLCAAFTVTVDKGIKSGVNKEAGADTWSHGSRVICGTSSVIGYSVKGRAIPAYFFGSGATTILFTGAIHGNETSAYTTMMGWVNWLQTNAHTLPADRKIVVVPNVNPDGISTGSRNNANNVNVGRNFPTANWKADIETASGMIKNGGGTSAGSEPEARALMALTRQLRPRMEISYHSQGRLVGANKFGDSVAAGNIYSSTVGYRTMYTNAEAVMGYEMTGEYEDWMGETMGLPAILIELPSHSGNYIQSQLPAILKVVKF